MDMADNTIGDMLLGFGALVVLIPLLGGLFGRTLAVNPYSGRKAREELNSLVFAMTLPGIGVFVLGLIHWCWWMFQRGYVW
jgi:hypothetical protein